MVFVQSKNVTMAIIDMLNYATNIKANRFITFSLFIAISKAFDLLSHLILLDKLQYYMIQGIVHQWFASRRSNRFYHFQIKNSSSSLALLTIGISQGSIPWA